MRTGCGGQKRTHETHQSQTLQTTEQSTERTFQLTSAVLRNYLSFACSLNVAACYVCRGISQDGAHQVYMPCQPLLACGIPLAIPTLNRRHDTPTHTNRQGSCLFYSWPASYHADRAGAVLPAEGTDGAAEVLGEGECVRVVREILDTRAAAEAAAFVACRRHGR